MKDKIAEILREYRTKVIVEEETKVRVYDLELNIADQILALFKEAELKMKDLIDCPYCGEDSFDLIGLKTHLLNDCKQFEETETFNRLFQ